jgi:hypothetical protein
LILSSNKQAQTLPSDSRLDGKLGVLTGRLMQQSGRFGYDDIVDRYGRLIKALPAREKAYFELARYYDSLWMKRKDQSPLSPSTTTAATTAATTTTAAAATSTSSRSTRSSSAPAEQIPIEDLALNLVRNYGNSLRYGQQFIYQSLPRLLTVWFDSGPNAEVGVDCIKGINSFVHLTHSLTHSLQLTATHLLTHSLHLIL